MKTIITTGAVLLLLLAVGTTAARAGTKCDDDVKGAAALYDHCAASTNSCDEWQVSRLITLTAAISTCAKAGNEHAKLFLRFMSIHADAAPKDRP